MTKASSIMMFRAFLFIALNMLLWAPVSAEESTLDWVSLTPKADKSIQLLEQIFGQIDGLGQHFQSGTSVFSTIFTKFNQVVLALATLLVLYTLVVGTIQTAQQGKFLGEKWSSMWVPMRTVLGALLIVPSSSGYSYSQTAVMWITLRGIAAAQIISSAGFNHISQGSPALRELDKPRIVQEVLRIQDGKFLPRLIGCLACVELENQEAVGRGSDFRMGTSDLRIVNNKPMIKFGSLSTQTNDTDPKAGAECGSIVFDNLGSTDPITASKAVLNLVTNLTSSNNSEPSVTRKFIEAETQAILGNSVTAITPETLGDVEGWVAGFYNAYPVDANSIVDSNNQRGILESLAQSDNWKTNKSWINLGAYYFSFGPPPSGVRYYPNVNQNFAENTDLSVLTKKILPPITEKVGQVRSLLIAKNAVGEAAQAQRFEFNAGAAGGIATILTGFDPGDFANVLRENKDDATDPIQKIVTLGQKILVTSTAALITTSTLVPIMGLVGVFQCQVPTTAIFNGLITVLVPIIITMRGFAIVQGGLMAIVLPMTPFLIFFASVLGWFMAVFESMVAAPLVAFGLLDPEGHEVYGRAEPALMLMLNLFLRPPLMVIGLLAGFYATSIAIRVFNQGLLALIEQGNITYTQEVFAVITLSFVYISVVLTIVNRTYALIHEIPNKTLRWIGDNSQAFQGAEDFLGAADKGMQRGGEMASGAMSSGSKAQTQSVFGRRAKKEGGSGGGTGDGVKMS